MAPVSLFEVLGFFDGRPYLLSSQFFLEADQDQGGLPQPEQPVEAALPGHPECREEVDHADTELELDPLPVIDIFLGQVRWSTGYLGVCRI